MSNKETFYIFVYCVNTKWEWGDSQGFVPVFSFKEDQIFILPIVCGRPRRVNSDVIFPVFCPSRYPLRDHDWQIFVEVNHVCSREENTLVIIDQGRSPVRLKLTVASDKDCKDRGRPRFVEDLL